jgi:RsiW-degrading membrane proteinase PrsW (M82 family)
VQSTQLANDDANRLERVTRNRGGLWESIAFELLGLLAFVLLFNFVLFNLGDLFGDVGRIVLGTVFAVVPAAIWLVFFYRFDRREPEPKQMVINVFVLGALIMAAIYQPVLHGIFNIDEWLYRSAVSRFFGGVLVVGFIEQFVIYLAVRYGVFDHPEFDERVDGVIYAVAAGLGVATVVNFIYVWERGGVDLDIGSIRVVVNALAYASLAGVLGYFIAQTRFEKTPVYYLPAGLTLTAALHGIFFALLGRTARGFNVHPWGDLWLATILAGLLLLLAFWLINRANEETLRLARSSAPTSWGAPTQAARPAAAVAATNPAPAQSEIPPSEGGNHG